MDIGTQKKENITNFTDHHPFFFFLLLLLLFFFPLWVCGKEHHCFLLNQIATWSRIIYCCRVHCTEPNNTAWELKETQVIWCELGVPAWWVRAINTWWFIFVQPAGSRPPAILLSIFLFFKQYSWSSGKPYDLIICLKWKIKMWLVLFSY